MNKLDFFEWIALKAMKKTSFTRAEAFSAGQQSMQMRIDQLEVENVELVRRNDNQYKLIGNNETNQLALKDLLQKLIEDEYTTMRPSIAYEIQKVLSGEPNGK